MADKTFGRCPMKTNLIIKIASRGSLCLLLILSWMNARAQDDPSNARRVEWLKMHAVRLDSIDPAAEDFSDLMPFKKIIGDAKVVLLGEQSHGDGAVFHAKTRLIKFLHQECGFDVLAFESGLYDCRKGWEQIVQGMPTAEAVSKSVFGIWTRSREFAPLISYLDAAKATARPLELAGFDCQFTGANSRDFLLSDLEAFLKSKQIDPSSIDAWPEFHSLFKSLVSGEYRKKAPKAAAEERFLKTLDEIRGKIPQDSSRERGFWGQLLVNIGAEARGNFHIARIGQQNMKMEDSQYRDTRMGENIVWLSRLYYPNRKIIVWAASRHNAYALRDVETSNDSLTYKGFINMGDYVREGLGKSAYNLGFTSYQGRFGTWMYGSNALDKPSPVSLETLFERTGFDQFILDFKEVSAGGEWLRDPWVARPFGYAEMTARWPHVFDGICFIKTMTPSDPVDEVPGNAVLLQYADAASCRGREILFRVRMKAEMKEQSRGDIGLRVDRENGKPGFYKSHTHAPITANEWKTYEIRGKADDDGKKICLILLFSGDGRLWVDEISLSYLDETGGEHPVPVENPGFDQEAGSDTADVVPGWRVNFRPSSMTFKMEEGEGGKGTKCLLIEYDRNKKKT